MMAAPVEITLNARQQAALGARAVAENISEAQALSALTQASVERALNVIARDEEQAQAQRWLEAYAQASPADQAAVQRILNV